MNVLAKFHWKLSIQHTLLIYLKMRDSLEKQVQVFTFIRFVNMSRPLRQICQLEKPPASETTESLAFTRCKVELRCQVTVLQSCFRRIRSRPVVNNNRQNRRKVMCNKTKGNWGAIGQLWDRINLLGAKRLLRSPCILRIITACHGLLSYVKKSLFPHN